jgi:single-stranded DNA-binding protein
MRAYMNHIVIAGNVVRPGKKMFTKNKKPYVLFTVAVERPRVQGKEMGTDFVNCCSYIHWHAPILLSDSVKGRQAIVVGRLNSWVTKDEGKYKSGYQIVTDRLSIVPPLDKQSSGDYDVGGGEDAGPEEDDEEGPPF